YQARAREPFPDAVRVAADKRIAADPLPGAAQHQLERYYVSTREPGPERLREHLWESAMFTQRLYQAGFIFSAVVLVGFLLGTALVIILMLIRGFGPHEHWSEFAVRLLIAVLAFIPASQELDHALLYRMMAERVNEMIKRVEDLWDPTIPRDQLE